MDKKLHDHVKKKIAVIMLFGQHAKALKEHLSKDKEKAQGRPSMAALKAKKGALHGD